ASCPEKLPAGDLVQPEPEWGALLELIEMAPGLQECLLGQVLSGLAVSSEVEQVAVDAWIVVTDEAVSRLGIADAKLDEEVSIDLRQRAILRPAAERGSLFGHVPLS